MHNAYVIWKSIVLFFFPIIGEGIVWKVGNGKRVTLGEDPWVGCCLNFEFPLHKLIHLRDRGFYKLGHVADPRLTSIWR
jgi:hypothetical protein